MTAPSPSAPAAAPGARPADRTYPTVWGLTPPELHDRFWAARGVQVVRQGQPSVIVEDAELFLLLEPRSLVIFRLRDLVSILSWGQPDILFVRLHGQRLRGYEERVHADPAGRFLGVERLYEGGEAQLARVALTRDRDLVRAWQGAPDPHTGWRKLRRLVRPVNREYTRTRGRLYDRAADADVMQFTRDLIVIWKTPAASVPRAARRAAQVWVDPDATVSAQVRFIGPAWVGAGRRVDADASVVGPAVLWDEPAQRPGVEGIRWEELEPAEAFHYAAPPRRLSYLSELGKRSFDILFAALALLLTLPLYPAIILAIYLEDGRPFLFAHRRETRGGREFGCLKFRSMRHDAEEIKAQLAAQNRSDGPQFFMQEDPRLTRVGRFLRRWNLDELPQFLNVLRGDMSIVGPRPSPRQENQFCPPWREARLSVRPGITGLWQVKRTRRAGLDFQEWIRHDLEYVQTRSWWLDLRIIAETVRVLVSRRHRS